MTVKRQLYDFLCDFWKADDTTRCLLVVGPSGSGKTKTIRSLVRELNHSEIYFSSLESNLMDSIKDMSSNLVSAYSVLDLMRSKQTNKQVAIIDDIDGVRLNDPSSFTALTKLVRKKRTKKQKTHEAYNKIPVICIGNSIKDKKTRELAKSCTIIEFPNSRRSQSGNNSYSELINNLFENPISTELSLSLSSQCDMTVLSMIWHENLMQGLEHKNKQARVGIYLKVLEALCFCDNIDKIAFSKQTWELADASGLLKLLATSRTLHSGQQGIGIGTLKKNRFTKILTKYSTAHNIRSFMIEISNALNIEIEELNALVRKSKVLGVKAVPTLSSIDKKDLARLERYIT